MGLFTGVAINAPSYSTSTSETPKWMQDAIYNQIYASQNIADKPYEGYDKQTVAGASPDQTQAWNQVRANQGSWAPAMQQAQQGTINSAYAPGGSQAAAPYVNQAAQLNGLTAASPYLNQAVGMNGVQAAQPYMQQAGQSAANVVGQYMNPYQQNVMDTMAAQGARNLSENLLPGVSDAFVRSGQFGSSRMGEFGSRALRDTQEAVLQQQGQLANQGYTQAMSAAQNDLGRQGQLASTAGGLTQAQQQAMMSAGQQVGSMTQAQQQALMSMGQQAGSLTNADLTRQQSAYGQLGALSQQAQNQGLTDSAALEAAGQAQQGTQQRQLDASYQQWQNQQNYPKQQMDWLSTQVRGMAPITPQTTTQNGYGSVGYSPSGLSQIASGLSLYKGLTSQ